MLGVWWVVVAAFAVVLVALLVTALAGALVNRMARLDARVAAARATLDAQLTRRAAAVEGAGGGRPTGLTDPAPRELVENRRSELVRELLGSRNPVSSAEVDDEIRESAVRVQIARRFYNDEVRAVRVLRGRRVPRALHRVRLLRERPLPDYFDIDDSLPDPPPAAIDADVATTAIDAVTTRGRTIS